MVSSHEPENSCEVLVYQWSNQRSSRHLPFTFSKKYISGPILVKLHINRHQVWKGKGCMCFWADWIGILAYRRIMGKTLKIFFSETARPTAYMILFLPKFMINVTTLILKLSISHF